MEERKCLALFLLSSIVTSAYNKIPVESECDAVSRSPRTLDECYLFKHGE